MDKEVPGESKGIKSISSVPPGPKIVTVGETCRRTKITNSMLPLIRKTLLRSMARRYSSSVPRIDAETLETYHSASTETELALNKLLGIKNIKPKERVVPRLRPIDGDGASDSDAVILFPKERIISKLREIREQFCITFTEKRTATKIINNLDKGCPGSIEPNDEIIATPAIMNAVLIMLEDARDFAKMIWDAEEITRIDEMFDKYDDLIVGIIRNEYELAEHEKKAGKTMVLKRSEGSPAVGRKELMDWFKANMMGNIKLDENGEEIYYSPEPSEYIGKMDEVNEAVALARDVLITFEVGVSAIYAERRKPFSVVQEKTQE